MAMNLIAFWFEKLSNLMALNNHKSIKGAKVAPKMGPRCTPNSSRFSAGSSLAWTRQWHFEATATSLKFGLISFLLEIKIVLVSFHVESNNFKLPKFKGLSIYD